MATRSELEVAYRATAYRVFLPGGAVALQVGVADPGFSAWLADNGVIEWVILTAWNPGSQPLPEAANRERQSALEVALLERGFEPYAGENAADGLDWPVEESCFVPGLGEAEATALAREFGQLALVAGGAGEPPRLVWVGE